MPIYACVDNREFIEIPESQEIPNQSDIEFQGHSYRKLDLLFVAWIRNRVLRALALRTIDLEQLGHAVLFAMACEAILGHPDRFPDVPGDYQKPDIAERIGWVRNVVWSREVR